METLRNLFAATVENFKSAWETVRDNLGWTLSICYGGLWFAFFNGFAIPIVAVYSWFVTSILTLLAWAGAVIVLATLGAWAFYCLLDLVGPAIEGMGSDATARTRTATA